MSYSEDTSQNIYITTNQNCNLSCIYCYEKNKSNKVFDLGQAKLLLNKYLYTKTKRGTLINFHGGEPFLVYSMIKELCEWAWNQNYPEEFIMFATSNGTLIHGKIQQWLEQNKHRFVVGLSLDGTREMHNLNRSNSFDEIDLDFFVRTWPNQSVKMTISQQTISALAEGVIFMHKKGFQDIRANLAEMQDWSNPQWPSIYQRELQKLALYYEQNPNVRKCSLFNVYFGSSLNPRIRAWCGAGTNMKVIDIDGSVHPCHLFFESVCGKEKAEKAQKLDFMNEQEIVSEHCKKCLLLPLCPTCYGANYITRDKINNRDLSLCELTKIRIREVATFEYNRIVNDTVAVNDLSEEERYLRLRTLEGIEKIHSILS